MENHPLFCSTDQFEQLLEAIKSSGYKLLGPTVCDDVIIYDELSSAKDLPIGLKDEQDPGRYRLKKRGDQAYFGYNLGPHSWKQFLFPPKEKLWTTKKDENNKLAVLQEVLPQDEKMAFIGVRACEIQAIFVLDKVFATTSPGYEHYQIRRKNTFILAVNCTTAANTCFCASMQSGPEVDKGYDLALTEVVKEDQHYFVLQFGSDREEKFAKEWSFDLPKRLKSRVPAPMLNAPLIRWSAELTMSKCMKC